MPRKTYSLAEPVTVGLNDLQSGSVDFSLLERAFGPDSLGIIVVSGLPPSFPELRRRVLSSASRVGSLPEDKLKELECPEAKYLVGWSCGKEKLSNDRVDTLKGSYYVNCAFYKSRELDGALGADRYPHFPEYTKGNIWPPEKAVPGFQETFKQLCTLIIDTAGLVARACDRYAEKHISEYTPGYLEHVVATSTTTKARLLHYFPPQLSAADSSSSDDSDEDMDSWCGTHLDHGCLTGLTSAMYTESHAEADTDPSQPLPEISSPDPEAGLYIKNRRGEILKVAIPRDCLAFQTGECLEVITEGRFKAVPHFVRGSKISGVARNTLAVFTQPNLWETVDKKNGVDFARFAGAVVDNVTVM